MAWCDRQAAFCRAAAEAAPLDLVAPAGVAGADAVAPPARGVAAVEPLALRAPVLPGAPPTSGDPAAGLPDLAVADAGVPFDAAAARPALKEAMSSVGATAVDRDQATAAAPSKGDGEGNVIWKGGTIITEGRRAAVNSRSDEANGGGRKWTAAPSFPRQPPFYEPLGAGRGPPTGPRSPASRATPPGGLSTGVGGPEGSPPGEGAGAPYWALPLVAHLFRSAGPPRTRGSAPGTLQPCSPHGVGASSLARCQNAPTFWGGPRSR